MMKREILAGLAVFWLTGAAMADTVEERLIAGLQAQGYVILEDGFTFLGRLRIVAENDQVHRELVVNPGTGEVLRDYAVLLADMVPPQTAPVGASHKSNTVAVAVATAAPEQPASPTRTHTTKGTTAAAVATTTDTMSGVVSSATTLGISATIAAGGVVIESGINPTTLLVEPIVTTAPGKP